MLLKWIRDRTNLNKSIAAIVFTGYSLCHKIRTVNHFILNTLARSVLSQTRSTYANVWIIIKLRSVNVMCCALSVFYLNAFIDKIFAKSESNRTWSLDDMHIKPLRRMFCVDFKRHWKIACYFSFCSAKIRNGNVVYVEVDCCNNFQL